MTPETREALTAIVRHAETIIDSYPSVIVVPNVGIGTKEIAALRDVLTPRTCANCRHAKFYSDSSEYGICRGDSIALGRDITEHDGCLRGWQAREGEGGTR